MRHQRLLLAVDHEGERGDRGGEGEADPADEHGGARADAQLGGERRVELDVQGVGGSQGGPSVAESSWR